MSTYTVQRVVENYYALQSTRIRPQRPSIYVSSY